MNYYLRTLLNGSICVAILGLLSTCKSDPLYQCAKTYLSKPQGNLSRIAFGSCADQNLDQSVLNEVVLKQPDLFIYLGDNIYGDTYNMHLLEAEYGKLSCKPEFQNLIAHVPVIATWDDHDYGHNDSGNDYDPKAESKQIFLRFFGEENNTYRQSHSGIYTSYYFGDSAHRVQIILLDLRTFRTPLKGSFENGYYPDYSTNATMLGDEQWNWLANELMQPAKLRIIGSSSRFDTPADGAECWANFPSDQNRMFDLIKHTHAGGVLFLSGDIHFGTLASRNEPGLYPLFDFTSSPLARHANEPWNNPYTLQNAKRGYNFGLLEINWQVADPVIYFKNYDINGHENFVDSTRLSNINF